MSKFKREVIHLEYSIEIDKEDFVKLSKHESSGNWYSDRLYAQLESITPAINVDYDFITGSHIFLTLSQDVDTPETWEAIESIIAKHLKRARKFQVNK